MLKYGFISPRGKYYTCCYEGHNSLAEKICKEKKWYDEILKYNSYVHYGDCEQYLYSKGYLCITSRTIMHGCMYSARIGNHRFPLVHLSKYQKKFLEDNLNNANNHDQLSCMLDALKWDKYVDERNNRKN